eukprot:2020799-Prymnesium_polylepis.1
MGCGSSRPITLIVTATIVNEAQAIEFYKNVLLEIRGYASSFTVYRQGKSLRIVERYRSNDRITHWLNERGFQIHAKHNRGSVVVNSITVLGGLNDTNRDLLKTFQPKEFDPWM